MLGQICCDTFLMRAFAQTIPLKQLIRQVIKVTGKKEKIKSPCDPERESREDKDDCSYRWPDNAGEHHLRGT